MRPIFNASFFAEAQRARDEEQYIDAQKGRLPERVARDMDWAWNWVDLNLSSAIGLSVAKSMAEIQERFQPGSVVDGVSFELLTHAELDAALLTSTVVCLKRALRSFEEDLAKKSTR